MKCIAAVGNLIISINQGSPSDKKIKKQESSYEANFH